MFRTAFFFPLEFEIPAQGVQGTQWRPQFWQFWFLWFPVIWIKKITAVLSDTWSLRSADRNDDVICIKLHSLCFYNQDHREPTNQSYGLYKCSQNPSGSRAQWWFANVTACRRILLLQHYATNGNCCTKMLRHSATLCDQWKHQS